MIHITELLTKDQPCMSYYVGGEYRWLPVPPQPFFSLRERWRDAWAVWCYRATPVDFSPRHPPTVERADARA